jgi:hypothetical protein
MGELLENWNDCSWLVPQVSIFSHLPLRGCVEPAKNGDPSSEEIIRGKDMLIGNLLRDIGMMRATFQSVVLGESDELPDAKRERERKDQGAWDDGYFSAYGHHSIHQEMLADR